MIKALIWIGPSHSIYYILFIVYTYINKFVFDIK